MFLDAWIKTFHIAFFAVGISMSEGTSLFVQSLLRAGSPDAERTAARAKQFDRMGAFAWLLCAATGLILVYRLRLDWTEKWLTISICLFVVLALNGIFGHARWLKRVVMSNGEPELLHQASKLKTAANLISLVVIFSILALMVVKPT